MNLPREYTKEALDPSNDVISPPKVITMFIPILKTLLTKILNPQVPPFVNPRPLASALLQKCCKTHLNTSHSSPKSRHDSIQSRHDFVWTAVVTSPFQVKLGEEVVESCHDFPNRVTIFHLKDHTQCLSNRVTVPEIVTRF